jgi:carboxymethylenebutenolidase
MAEETRIPVPGGGFLDGVVSRPQGNDTSPGVVVLHEIFGDQPEMRDVCDRFAERGYTAVMPDLFSTGGPRALCMARTMIAVARGRVDRALAQIDAARRWLTEQPGVDGERLGVIGFCFGGGFALAYAGRPRPGVRAVSVNYGEAPKDACAIAGICPVIASYGARDRIVGPHAERLRRNLEALGVEHDVKVYDDAGHSFMTDGRHPIGKLVYLPLHIGYVPDAARDAWQRVFAFFDTRLKDGGPPHAT